MLRAGILVAVLWFAATQLGALASSTVPTQAAAGCAWPCGGVSTAFSGGGGGNAQAVLGALPTPAQAIHLPSLISGAEAQIQSALP